MYIITSKKKAVFIKVFNFDDCIVFQKIHNLNKLQLDFENFLTFDSLINSLINCLIIRDKLQDLYFLKEMSA